MALLLSRQLRTIGCCRALCSLPTPTDPEKLFFPCVSSGSRLAYSDEGPRKSPRVAVLIHGAPGSGRDFRYLAPALVSRGIRVVRIDLPGYGESSPNALAPASVPSSAAFAATIQTQLLPLLVCDAARAPAHAPARGDGPQPSIFFIGHSLGSAVALELGASAANVHANVSAHAIGGDDGDGGAYLKRCHGVALLAPVGLRPHRALRQFGPFRRRELRHWLAETALALPVLRAALPPLLHTLYRRVLGFRRVSQREVVWTQRQVGALNFDRVRELYALLAAPAGRMIPVHIYAGTCDAMFEVQIFREAAGLLLGGHEKDQEHNATGQPAADASAWGYTELEGAGHALQKTHCHDIAASLDTWMLRAISHIHD